MTNERRNRHQRRVAMRHGRLANMPGPARAILEALVDHWLDDPGSGGAGPWPPGMPREQVRASLLSLMDRGLARIVMDEPPPGEVFGPYRIEITDAGLAAAERARGEDEP